MTTRALTYFLLFFFFTTFYFFIIQLKPQTPNYSNYSSPTFIHSYIEMGGALNAINCLNLVGFILNVSVTAFASQIFNFSDNATISAQYQTIITPSGFTFAIWGIIFLSQLIFTIAQMLPQYRSLPIVQDGVHYLYVYACLAQSAWTFLFGYEIFWLSVIIMFSILVPLYRIVMQQQQGMEGSLKEYWLFKFPVSY